MIVFLRLLDQKDKAQGLASAVQAYRSGTPDGRLFPVAPDAFDAVPGKPFACWVSDAVRDTFRRLPAFESEGRTARRGPSTCDDSR